MNHSANVGLIYEAAGLHITLKWQNGMDELRFTKLAEHEGIILRPLSYYEHPGFQARYWHGAVLGYGNIALENIDAGIQRLALIFRHGKQ